MDHTELESTRIQTTKNPHQVHPRPMSIVLRILDILPCEVEHDQPCKPQECRVIGLVLQVQAQVHLSE